MLLNQYKIYNDEGVYEHYEFRISQSLLNSYLEGSVAVSGISLIEECVSEIVERRVYFSLFRESRFFLCNMERGKDNDDGESMVLDISISGIDGENYEIVADIIESDRVLIEVCGVVSVSTKRDSV